MTKVNCKELAESFINGNISYVKKRLLGNSKVALRTSLIIFEYYGVCEFKTFIRVMTT